MKILLLALCLVMLCGVLTACAHWGAEPWERDILAKREMGPNHNGLEMAVDDHIYFSKEASSGGRGYGGGGCGCN